MKMCVFRIVIAVAAVQATVCGCMSVSEPNGISAKVKNPVKVGIYVGAGARSNGVCHWETLTTLSPDLEPTFLDEKTIAAGGLDGLDVLAMPGGSSYEEFDTLKTTGADVKIKEFIRNGGGYVGTCAGNCLVLNEERRLRLTPYEREKSSDRHGTALLGIKFNEEATRLCGIKAGTRKIRYSGGPIMKPGKPVAGANFKTIAEYDCDLVCEYGTNTAEIAQMKGAPAAICGTYGKGRVFAIAVHPEYREDTLDLVEKGFEYAVGRKVRLGQRQCTRGDLRVVVYAPGMSGIEDARMVAGLATARGIDVTYMNLKEEIGVGLMNHADVLVLPGGSESVYSKRFEPGAEAFFRKFAEQGGKVFSCGAGAKHAPAGATICASPAEIVECVKAER